MSVMEVSIKWKERSGAQSAGGTSKTANRSALVFVRANFSPSPKTVKPPSTRVKTDIDLNSPASPGDALHTIREKGRLTRRRICLTKCERLKRRRKAAPCVRMISLTSINQRAKRARDRLSLRMGILLRWSGSRTKIRGGQKKAVRLWIETHRFGAKLGFDRFRFRELVGGILMKNVELAHPGGDKQQSCFSIKDVGVHTGADGQRLDDLAIVRIHHHKKLRVAGAGKQPPVLTVHFYGHGRSGRR